MIWILTDASDDTADFLVDTLRRRAARFVRLDPGTIARDGALSVAWDRQHGLRPMLHIDKRTLDPAGAKAIWLRRPSAWRPSGPSSSLPHMFAEREGEHFLDDVWHTLPCRWLPAAPSAVWLAEHKLDQQQCAVEVGFTVPATLVGNDPDAVRAFYARHDGRIIVKPVHDGYVEADSWRNHRCFTARVSRRDLAYAFAVRYAPAIYQAYVEKAYELRVIVVGDRVFAARVASQASHRTRTDWRRVMTGHRRYWPVQLEEDVAVRCRAVTERLGLNFGVIDLICTPGGDHIFVEINPSGQWASVEQQTSLPIREAICDVLLA